MAITPSEHPIEKIMSTAMSRIKNLVQVDTVVGEPITVGGSTIIPISKVTVGLVAGGGEYGDNTRLARTHKDDYPFAGGSGAGVSVQPIGFLVKDEKGMRLISMDNETAYDKLLELVPNLVSAMFKKDKEK